jgi:regulator of sigma E protease
MITTLFAFLLTLAILIVIHEYGHYRVAVACGVKVLRFSVGFGRVVWRRQQNADSTEFVVCLLPLGGYVRMLDAREGEVPAHQRHLAFNHKPLWQRTAIVAAGPLANLLLAVLLYAGAHWIGIDEPKAVLATPPAASIAERAGVRAGDWVRSTAVGDDEWSEVRAMSELRWAATQAVLDGQPLRLVVSDREGRGERQLTLPLETLGAGAADAQLAQRIGIGSSFSEPVLADVKAGGPGDRAGLKAGDRVLRIDGRPVADAGAVRLLIRAAVVDGQARSMLWQLDRAGRMVELEVTPAVVQDAGRSVGRIEVVPGRPPEMVTVRYGVFEGIGRAAQKTWDMSALTVQMLGKMLIGEASLKNLSGPITIADYAGQSVQLGLAYYLGFLALVSVSLGVLNLLPLPMLDGGHLMYYLFEGVTGRPVSDLWLERLQRGGVAVLLAMMSLALYNDVARLLGLH